MNRAQEDYIKAIYDIESRQENELVSNVQLMRYFDHTAQSVNEMVNKLSQNSFVDYKPYKGSKLTMKGKTKAIRLIRVHRIWEKFLVGKLGYSWEEVHEEAEKFEHITSKKMEERLYSFLGEPEFCPHGNKIPDIDYLKEKEQTIKIQLNHTEENQNYFLESVIDDKDVLTYLNFLEIKIGDRFLVTRIDTMSEVVELVIKERRLNIGFKVAKHLYVVKN
jgi:DtxR family transcriptional regulator, Mn-dependent transcriptional regulator